MATQQFVNDFCNAILNVNDDACRGPVVRYLTFSKAAMNLITILAGTIQLIRHHKTLFPGGKINLTSRQNVLAYIHLYTRLLMYSLIAFAIYTPSKAGDVMISEIYNQIMYGTTALIYSTVALLYFKLVQLTSTQPDKDFGILSIMFKPEWSLFITRIWALFIIVVNAAGFVVCLTIVNKADFIVYWQIRNAFNGLMMILAGTGIVYFNRAFKKSVEIKGINLRNQRTQDAISKAISHGDLHKAGFFVFGVLTMLNGCLLDVVLEKSIAYHSFNTFMELLLNIDMWKVMTKTGAESDSGSKGSTANRVLTESDSVSRGKTGSSIV